MGIIKNRIGNDLTEAEEIKKRWQEYTEELYKKGFSGLDKHNVVVIHLEPEIMVCEAKWALGNITMNKVSAGDGITAELFQILKDDAVKFCNQYASRAGKLSSGHRTGKGQFSLQSQRKAMPKNAQTTSQSHMLVGEGNDTPLQYSCLENPMDGGAWKAAVHGVAEGRT